jgi:hypothetical protein
MCSFIYHEIFHSVMHSSMLTMLRAPISPLVLCRHIVRDHDVHERPVRRVDGCGRVCGAVRSGDRVLTEVTRCHQGPEKELFQEGCQGHVHRRGKCVNRSVPSIAGIQALGLGSRTIGYDLEVCISKHHWCCMRS